MAPAVPALGLSEAPGTGLNSRNSTIATSETSLRSQTWKNILQQPLSAWRRRQNDVDKVTKNASNTPHADQNTLVTTTRSANTLPEHTSGHYGTASSHPPASSLQSDSQVSLTSASLFSRNSYPSVFSTSTDATSVSGVYTTCGITCPVDSPLVKAYKRLKNNLVVYLARDDIEKPKDVVEQWETTDLDRLKTDLSEVVMKVYRKGVERELRQRRSASRLPAGAHEYDISFELRMSGRATRDAQHVAIGPSIWLICASDWACEEIRTAMDEITWPTLPVEIHKGCVPMPAVAEGEVDINKLDLTDGYNLGDGITLYIHVEDSIRDATSCGLLCCATIRDGDAYSHHFSRIGGLVTTSNTLTSSQFGVSTAHGILDHPWWHRQLWKMSPGAEWESRSNESSGSEDEDDLSDDDLYDDDHEHPYAELQSASDLNSGAAFSMDNKSGEGYRDPGLVSRWRNVTHHGLISFLGTSVTTEKGLRQSVQLYDDMGNQTDHAMIRLESSQQTSPQPYNNTYRPQGALLERSVDITTHINNDKLGQGSVSIICQSDTPLDGRLLPGSTCLAMGGMMFKLRKLKVAAPLARGVSGSWVARDKELCGMVIAVSNPEPYVYMMGAEDLFSNLGASSPSIETIEVFNSGGRAVKHETDRTLRQKWSSSRLHPRSAAANTPAMAMVDDRRPTGSIKRGFSKRLKSLGGASPVHEAAGSEMHGDKGVKPRRTRSVRGLLSDMFRTRIEEIIQREDGKGSSMAQAPIEVRRRPSAAGSHTHKYYVQQAKTRWRHGRARRVCTLEPISEVSSVVAFGVEEIPELENVFLQSTTCAPATPFRHGPIRLHKLDLIPRQEIDLTVDHDSLGPKVAPSRTAYDWFSDNYQDQQEEEVDEVGDLIDWWESWGIDDPDDPIPDCPPSPMSTTSDDFPGVSYSDTTSEESVSSCYADLGAQQYFPPFFCGDALQDLNEVSEAGVNKLGPGVVVGSPGEICEDDCIPGIISGSL